jgi:TM2 domain-containing membrane protein YozV
MNERQFAREDNPAGGRSVKATGYEWKCGGFVMRVCPNCGFRMGNEARFCVQCNTILPELKETPVPLPLKDLRTVLLIAGVVGAVFMGAGHFYVYRIARGLALLVAGTITGMIFIFAALGGFFDASTTIAALVGGVRLVLWGWQTRDAIRLGKAYNDSVRDSAQIH